MADKRWDRKIPGRQESLKNLLQAHKSWPSGTGRSRASLYRYSVQRDRSPARQENGDLQEAANTDISGQAAAAGAAVHRPSPERMLPLVAARPPRARWKRSFPSKNASARSRRPGATGKGCSKARQGSSPFPVCREPKCAGCWLYQPACMTQHLSRVMRANSIVGVFGWMVCERCGRVYISIGKKLATSTFGFRHEG